MSHSSCKQSLLLRGSILMLLFFGLLQSTKGQVASIEQTLAELQQNVKRVNQLADNRDIYAAMDLLNKTRRDFDSYISHYLEDEYRNALTENETYSPRLSLQFSQRLTATFWEERVRQSERALTNAKEAFAARNHQRTLNAQDQVWAYLKSAYTIAATIKDVTENIIAQNYVAAAQSAYEGSNDFIESYQEIEDTRLQIINTERYEIEMQQLIKRAEQMEENNWQFASYMRVYEQDTRDFERLADRFNSLISTLASEPVKEEDEWAASWNNEPYLSRIKQAGRRYETNNQNYREVEREIRGIIAEAESRKDELAFVIGQSESSAMSRLLEELEADYDEFYNLAIDVVDECYRFAKPATGKQPGSETERHANSNAQQQVSTAIPPDNNQSITGPGQRAPNMLYHSYWMSSSGAKMKLTQEGSQVLIDGKAGSITNGVLQYNYQDSDGSRRTDEYHLLGDGYIMDERREWSDRLIKDHLMVRNNFTAPSPEQIAEFRKNNPRYITIQWKYAGGTMAMYGDTDRDQVPDDMDACPDTPAGLTVSNGGVDIRGCTLDSRVGVGSDTATPSQSATTDDNSVQDISNRAAPVQKNGTTSQTSKKESVEQRMPETRKVNQGSKKTTSEELFHRVSGGFSIIGREQ